MKLKDLSNHVASCKKLVTAQYNHLPCVVDYLHKQVECDFNLKLLSAKEVIEDITKFCHLVRDINDLKLKIRLLGDSDA